MVKAEVASFLFCYIIDIVKIKYVENILHESRSAAICNEKQNDSREAINCTIAQSTRPHFN